MSSRWKLHDYGAWISFVDDALMDLPGFFINSWAIFGFSSRIVLSCAWPYLKNRTASDAIAQGYLGAMVT